MHKADADELWAFAELIYDAPARRDIFLTLQDRFGLDVNLLIFCIWTGLTGRGARPREDISAAMAALAPWQGAVILPLRSARRALKAHSSEPAYAEIKEKILSAELAAEKVAQMLLLEGGLKSAALSTQNGEAAMRANLALYCKLKGIGNNDEVNALIARLCETAMEQRR